MSPSAALADIGSWLVIRGWVGACLADWKKVAGRQGREVNERRIGEAAEEEVWIFPTEGRKEAELARGPVM